MQQLGEGADVFVPDDVPVDDALARVTDLGIVAHPDDLEFLAIAAIGECAASEDRWFGGVVLTDGGGSAPPAGETQRTDELVRRRRDEQRNAARVGEYAAVVQLGHSSAWVRSADGQAAVVGQLERILLATQPTNVYTHNLADKHETHLATGSAAIKAVRRLPSAERPVRMVGVEGWRDLDWLPDHDKVRMDVTRFEALAGSLASVFGSQLEGKRYDLAAEGRRRANATIFEPREADRAEQVVVAMDLTPLARNDDVDPVRYITFAIDRFREEAERALSPYW